MSKIHLSFNDFDFTSKRVRFQGKSLSKFELSWYISQLDPFSCYAIYPDFYKYDAYKDCLFKKLSNLAYFGF